MQYKHASLHPSTCADTCTQKTYSSLDCKCGVAASAAADDDGGDLITYAATRRAELPQKVCRSMSLMTGILQVDHWFAGAGMHAEETTRRPTGIHTRKRGTDQTTRTRRREGGAHAQGGGGGRNVQRVSYRFIYYLAPSRSASLVKKNKRP